MAVQGKQEVRQATQLSAVLYSVHLNKKEHVFCEKREYWQKAHRSRGGLALGSSAIANSKLGFPSGPASARESPFRYLLLRTSLGRVRTPLAY